MSEPAIIEGEIEKPKKNGNGKRKVAIVESALPVSADTAWLETIRALAPSIGIEGVRELMTMRREERRDANEREFNAAMSAAQAALVPVAKNRKNDQTRSTYADMAAIADAAMPIIYAHGFGVITSEFESKKPDHLGVACEVTHKSGHSKRYEFNIPWDGTGMKGNANKTATHAYGSTLQYGERYAKCKVFGIATKDDDGNAAGAKQKQEACVSEEQVKKLNEMILKTPTPAAAIQIIFEHFKIDNLSELTVTQHDKVLAQIEDKYGVK